MNKEIYESLVDQAGIVLANDCLTFEGNPQNAAEYVYFRAIREGIIQKDYWILQALDITKIADNIDLVNLPSFTLDEIKEETDEGICAEGQRADNDLGTPIRDDGQDVPRSGDNVPDMVRGGSQEDKVPDGDSGADGEKQEQGNN